MGGHTHQEMGEGFELGMCDWRLCPLAKHGGQKRSKGKCGQQWLSLVGRLDTPTAFWCTWDSGRGLLRWNVSGSEKPVGFFPFPGRRHVNGGQHRPVIRGLEAQSPNDAWN